MDGVVDEHRQVTAHRSGRVQGRMVPKVVLVTAASAGLGAATARILASAGHTAYAGVGSTSSRPSGGPVEPDEPGGPAGPRRGRPRPRTHANPPQRDRVR
jgi:hypothetical protein